MCEGVLMGCKGVHERVYCTVKCCNIVVLYCVVGCVMLCCVM